MRQLQDRFILVEFPIAGVTLRLAAASDALHPLVLLPGSQAVLQATSETVTIEAFPAPGRVRLTDGRDVDEAELWPVDITESLVERLALGVVDSLEAFSLRLDALHLRVLREAEGLGSFLGGRIRLFPHQLYIAERATRSDPVRWLLADEVGLGKTVEACLILNHLLRTGRADRALVVAPQTLTVQWLGELWRKYHQIFVLLDDRRLTDVEKDFGRGFNPFDAHRRVVVGLEFLRDHPRLTEQAVAAGVELLIVDEAHHLRRPPGHPGTAEYRAIQPMAALGRHLLLLTATPLEEDAHGFFRLLQLLRPDEFPESISFEERLRESKPLPPCTSATRRVDVGGLPPRLPVRITPGSEDDWQHQLALERAVRALPTAGAMARQRKLRLIRRALASGHALEPLLERDEEELRCLARQASRHDPRTAWLLQQAPAWKRSGDKTLVFVAHRETLEQLRAALSRHAQLRTGVFHEDLSPGHRDIEVAQFRLASGPSLLISTECGGEGRNFEFCTRLLLFDLPWSPMRVEQRIGRLDRIGRRLPVEVMYFSPPAGFAASVVELYEMLGLFKEPLGGLERELGDIERLLETLALSGGAEPGPESFAAVVQQTRRAQDRVRQAAYHELHRSPYKPELAQEILARVPAELEELTQEVVIAACEQLQLHVEEHRQGRRYSIELDSRARVESLPGVPGGASFLGTFDREEAVQDETIDFLASGHPLVEGLLGHLEDSPEGRVGLLHVAGTGQEGFGLLALYQQGPRFEAVAVDLAGRVRADWAELLTRRPLRSKRVRAESWTGQPGWPELIREGARKLAGRRRPLALAAFRIEP